MIVDLDLRVFHDGYKERIEALINSKMKGEVARVEGCTEAVGACLSCFLESEYCSEVLHQLIERLAKHRMR